MNVATRRRVNEVVDETTLKEAARYGGDSPRSEEEGRRNPKQPFFGVTIVSCDHGDIRQTPDGLIIYGDDGNRRSTSRSATAAGTRSSKSSTTPSCRDAPPTTTARGARQRSKSRSPSCSPEGAQGDLHVAPGPEP